MNKEIVVIEDVIARELKRICNPVSVLDVGCGRNQLVSSFQELGIEAVGIDISHNERHKPNVLASGEKMPFKDDTFDLITCIEVIEHMFYPTAFVKESRRVLKDGGYLYLTTPTPLKDMIYKVFFVTDDILEHVSVKREKAWICIFNKFGFTQISNTEDIEIEITRFFHNTPPKSRFARLIGKKTRNKLISLQRRILFSITTKKLFKLNKG
jgi:2-polyprenyl-3-methyl-5-hydroxy-6-metoxy-1,4-benzoquinol methylase